MLGIQFSPPSAADGRVKPTTGLQVRLIPARRFARSNRRVLRFGSRAVAVAIAIAMAPLPADEARAEGPSAKQRRDISSARPTAAPRHVPPPVRSAFRGVLRRRPAETDRRARAATWDATGRVFADSNCDVWSNGIAWTMASHPSIVRPTISGRQLIAFRLDLWRSDGVRLGGTDWWFGTAESWGDFVAAWDSYVGLWYFRNARTGEKARNVTPWAEGLARGYGHRWAMKVAWYVNGSVTSQTSFWVSVRGNPYASCWT